MKLIRYALLTVVVIVITSVIALSLQSLFGIKPTYSISGFIVVFVAIVFMINWEFSVRLPARRRLILKILSDSGEEMTGLQIVKASNGKLGRGTIYVYLQSLEHEGRISRRIEERSEPRLPMHYFKIVS